MGDKLSTGNVFEDNIGGTLRRQPSLLDLDLNTSSKSRNTALPEYGIPSGRKTRVVVRHDSSNEVIPDSEEERVRARGSLAKEVPKVIEISSDSEDEQPRRRLFRRLNDDKSKDVPAAMPGGWPGSSPSVSAPLPRTPKIVTTFGRATPALLGEDTIDSSTTTHVSDSQEVSSLRKEPEVIELTDSEPEPVKERPKPRPRLEVNTTRPPPPAGPRLSTPKMLPLYADEEPWEADDGSILTLNEPKKARTPFRKKATPGPSNVAAPSVSAIGVPRSAARTSSSLGGDSEGQKSRSTASANIPETLTRTPKTPKQPRMTKKAQAEANQAKRAAYAEELFAELNHSIFKDGLPTDTKLVWNTRLLTTAGKAKWHRSSDGTRTTSIELASKILDCEERIRNTLSHEMCHLACWIIDNDSAEGHGSVWNKWVRKVTRYRPDIVVSTKHNYEIAYKYEWRCEKCSKIYGRFSKSIKPEECVCGACREGTLVPLFTTRQRTPKTPKTNVASPMAAEKGRDSPISVIGIPESPPATPSRCNRIDDQGTTFTLESDTVDSDIEDITRLIRAVEIGT